MSAERVNLRTPSVVLGIELTGTDGVGHDEGGRTHII